MAREIPLGQLGPEPAGVCREAYLSALEACPEAPPWFPRPHGDGRRAQCAGESPVQGPQEALRL